MRSVIKVALYFNVVFILNIAPTFAMSQEEILDIKPETSEEEVLEGLVGIEDEINRDIEEDSLQLNYLKLAESALINDNDVVNKDGQLEQLTALESIQEETIGHERTYLEEIEKEITEVEGDITAEKSEAPPYDLKAMITSNLLSAAALLVSVGITAFVAKQAHHALLKRRHGYTSLNAYEQQAFEPI